MAVSGSQLTRIGTSIAGVGKKLTITAKAASTIIPVENNLVLQWNISEQVDNNLILQWNAEGRIINSNLLQWDITNPVEASTTIQWNIDQFIQQSVQLQWTLSTTISTLTNIRTMLIKANTNKMTINQIDQYLKILKG